MQDFATDADGAYSELTEMQQQFMATVADACGGTERLDEVTAAYSRYLLAMQEAAQFPDAAERMRVGYEQFVEALRGSLREDAAESTQGAYDQFLSAVPDLWSTRMPPDLVMSLGQTLISVAWTASVLAAAAGGQPQSTAQPQQS